MLSNKKSASFCWLPKSFFARMLWLILVIVLFSKALTLGYLLLNEDVLVDRQYSHGAAMLIRAYWSVDDESRDDIAIAAGILWKPDNEAPQGEYHWPYSDIFQRQIRGELGEDANTRLIVGDYISSLWVSAPSLGPGWLEIPMYPHPLRGQQIWRIIAGFIAIVLLSTFTAGIFVLQLNQPLKRLVYAARQLGKGRGVHLPTNNTLSEMTEVYTAFNQMSDDVEKANSERDLMLAGVSHDLRTPLTRLRLSVELMDGDEEFKDDMVRDIEDMNEILDQFIAFIRDGRDEALEELDLNELVKEVVIPFNQNEQKVRLFLEDVPLILGRWVSLKRLMVNLINNALNYSHDVVEVTTYLANKHKSPYVVFSVLDRGPGIPEEEISKVFDPFMRGNAARSGKGSGLGLAIVKRIVEQQGAHIELLNRVGGGLEAKVCLPIGLKLPNQE